MKILRTSNDNNILLNYENNFQSNLGWSENFADYEQDMLDKITNDIENYETVRYLHKPYTGITSNVSLTQSDIWFYFYFISGNTYVQDYETINLLNSENASLTKSITNSFFRLEFYKTPNNETPDRTNRKLVFAKNLTLPSGERFFSTKENLNELIYVPVFMGNNYKNKENMYFFWFQDETPYDDTPYTGKTFWMTAKYFNAKDGEIIDFTNTCMSKSEQVNETEDLYYQVELDSTNNTYEVFYYDGVKRARRGLRNNPIKFYEKGGASC
jgi:hypothetical protein